MPDDYSFEKNGFSSEDQRKIYGMPERSFVCFVRVIYTVHLTPDGLRIKQTFRPQEEEEEREKKNLFRI